MTENDELFICTRGDAEHQLIMTYSDADHYKAVGCSVHLNPERNFFKRIVSAVKYIFGYRSIYGDFTEFTFTSSDADKLQEVVDHLRHIDKYEKEREAAFAASKQGD